MKATLRAAIYARSGGTCDRCGLWVSEDGFHAHHRQLRSRGGKDTTANLAVLHPACHGVVHINPARATSEGFMVPSWANPETTPILRHGRTWTQPGDGWTAAEPITEGASK